MRFFRNIITIALGLTVVLLFLISPKFVRTSPYESFIGNRNSKRAGLWVEPLDEFKEKKTEKFNNYENKFYHAKEDCIFNSTCQLMPNNHSFFRY
tara:strand:+ start:436 stop:720 length:285 start_codon:yes stop_codon:yes gene_type:complete